MADPTPSTAPSPAPAPSQAPQDLGGATYEIIRQRLQAQAAVLRERMGRLDARRQEVFGRVEWKLLQADRITTVHNCIPVDMVSLGAGRFLVGFSVQFGLKKEVEVSDIFGAFHRDEAAGMFKDAPLDVLSDRRFQTDFRRLFTVYERAAFSKFSLIDGHLYMVFRTGAGSSDLSVFKWAYRGGQLAYVDGRAEAEYRKVGFPQPFEFRWRTPDRESFRYGDHPHVSIEDRVFVECVGGDLTIKVEDNTATGEGVYSEPVDDRHQKVDDAEISYAIVDHLVLLRIRPYKETAARCFIYNGKVQSAVRVDSIGHSCALLPEDQGLVFPDGYYLATGELKVFEAKDTPMVLERVVHAPGGEDSLYVFFRPETGQYALLPYRLIERRVEERIGCHGFSLFPTGHLALIRAEDTPQKHHMIQLRQSPFHEPGHEPAGRKDTFLYQVGNKEVVRCLAESGEILSLALRENPYAELYTDLVRRCSALLDTHPWLTSDDGFEVDDALRAVREAADKAVDEFAKVRRLRQEAVQRVAAARRQCEERTQAIRRAGFRALSDFVGHLTGLRHLRGELITLREVRYVDVAQIEVLEKGVVEQLAQLSDACVKFLLKPEALEPYRKQAAEHLAGVDRVAKVADGRKVEKAVADAGGELEMLIEIVNGLRIEDATETTRIIDAITGVYSTLNQVKAALKKRLQALVAAEGAAQFNAQLKLLSQSAASYLDLCDTPARCDEYLNRLTVQIEEMEGAFAGFDEYTVQLTDRRTELYEAFEQRKIALVEQRNRRAQSLLGAGERILKVIQNRLAGFKTLEEIHTYMASDLMTSKVRETIDELLALGDSVKADDLQGRLKTVQQDAVRQLRDRQELFVDGSAVIQLGKHRFNINTQPLDLTVVLRDDAPSFHLTSTQYFDPITDAAYLETRSVWNQEVISENADVYRAEYLAWRLLRACEEGTAPRRTDGLAVGVQDAALMTDEARFAWVQEVMSARYQEGYAKGIHDADASTILKVLAGVHLALQTARFQPVARACAAVYWARFCPAEMRALWTAKLRGFGARNRLFPGEPVQGTYIRALQGLLSVFVRETGLYPEATGPAAGEYLFHELTNGDAFAVTREAEDLASAFRQHLVAKGHEDTFDAARESLAGHPASELELVRDWLRGFLLSRPADGSYLEEAVAVVFCGGALARTVVHAATRAELEGMRGSHARVEGSRYRFDYLEFTARLGRFETHEVPRFQAYHALKLQLLDRERRKLRLEEFKPKVLSTFVRNQLTDRVYLPLVGDNLAKQIGAAGAAKRTDRMGLLLLISPPGYGKTTLLEYIASRLGIVFVKINGPALGHNVTSLDPQEAPNAAAREEIHKLNLALEMGDNAMICVDDIQHCSPEFLQKFISLCDAQRRIEGVWRGQPRTYDLRGRKVVVVMAGNPYTESGQKFRIPDMLANRADTYNLGDIVGGNAEWFEASYLENAVASNPVLAPLANRSQADVRTFVRLASSGAKAAEGLEGQYSPQELEEILSVLRKLVLIRSVVMRVNQEYIHSAAQADEFRTEPPFRLQGSYRNMNRLAEKVVAIMNDDEVRALVVDHYRGESQTLTTGAEANLLKFKEMIGALTPEEKARWEDICRTFRRNQTSRGVGENDPVGRVVAQLSGFQQGLESIQLTLDRQLSKPPAPLPLDLGPVVQGLESVRSGLEKLGSLTAPASLQSAAAVAPGGDATAQDAVANRLAEGLAGLREDLTRAITAVHTGSMADKVASLSHELEMIHSTLATLKDAAVRQRDHLRAAQELLAVRARQGTIELEVTQDMLSNEEKFLEQVHRVLSGKEGSVAKGGLPPVAPPAAVPPPVPAPPTPKPRKP